MLIRVGHRIVNTDAIVHADYNEEGENAGLTVYCQGQYPNGKPIAFSLAGDSAEKFWNELCNEATDVGEVATPPGRRKPGR